LVDVRNRDDFKKSSIPGSINIPLFAIKTKAFLKSKSLILINEGYNYCQLERECERLRKSGFSVWLLNGGLNYWRKKGAPLMGDPFAQKELNKIPPAVFFAEKDYENWIVIDVSPSKHSEACFLIPRTIFIPYENNEKKFISTFKKTVAQHKDNAFISALLFTEKGVLYDKIEKVIKKTDSKPVFFLKGGIEAYRKFLEKQAIIRQAKHNSRKTLKKCSSCP
ncbi:rhodanese-like domain-containing protein, partial [bacterium]|nr:rhodanese-like domain-containing protein [bacterium]